MDLFEHAAFGDTGSANVDAPLAERMRPRALSDVVGQPHLVGPGSFLRGALAQGRVPSMILWGPPGTGKTTIAEALSREVKGRFVRMSAVLAGIKEIREAVEVAHRARVEHRTTTLLFVDEIHRFNKAQQDALLPHVEKGTVTLVGATTENPSFEVNAALLSRCRVLVTKPIGAEDLTVLVHKALADVERGLGARALSIDAVALKALLFASGGDARKLLTALEVAADMANARGQNTIAQVDVEQAVSRRVVLYDKNGDEHYNVISAFIKSMRGSDPDAALHYMARMIEAGEDPIFILRRMVIFASEDVGNADPQALAVATNALTAFQLIGMPEGALPMSQACLYLATAPKSNTAIVAYHRARKDVLAYGALPVPTHLRNAPTTLMANLGYGADYKYPHDYQAKAEQLGGFVPAALTEPYLPKALVGRRYYEPTQAGFEATIDARMRLRAQATDAALTQHTHKEIHPARGEE